MKPRRPPKQPAVATPPPAAPEGKPADNPGTGGPARRRWFRLLALLFPLLLLVATEVGLRLAGYGWPTAFFLQETSPQGSVLVENPQFGWRFFPPAVARTPQPIRLAVAKPPNTIRIFVFGESAAMGDPEPAYGFPRQLERLLAASDPTRHYEVVNTAMTAINSHVLREIARDCARHQGDFWVVYAGNNEVVGPFGAGTVFGPQAPSLAVIRAGLLMKSTRLGQWLSSLHPPSAGSQEWQGMEMFLHNQVRADAPSLRIVRQHFASNLAALTELGRQAGATVLLATVPVNLQDSPPFASQHRPDLTAAQLDEWNQGFRRGCAAQEAGRFAEALTAFNQVGQSDSTFAELPFRRALCELALGQTNAAAADYRLACDLDTLRFRADSGINETTRRVAADHSLALIDAELACTRHSPGAIPGESLFYDHVHLNFTGNYLVASLFADQIAAQLGARPGGQGSGWLSEAEVARQLAFTDFDRRRIAEEMQARLRLPPFVSQLNFRAREDAAQALITRLDRAPTSFVEDYRVAVAGAPQDWVLHANYGRLLEAASQEAAAVAEWQAVAQLLPQAADAWFHLGNLAYSAGAYAAAEGHFRQALRRQPASREAWNGLGLALAAEGQFDPARAAYQSALRLAPTYTAARINLAVTLVNQRQAPAAIAEYRTVLQQETNNVAARINLARLLAGEGQSDEAIALFQQALALQPGQPVASFDLANALAAQGRHAEALPYYLAAVRSKPDFAEARFNLAMEWVRAGNLLDALPQLAEVVRLQPDFVNGRYNYGVALAKQQRYAEAAEQFQATLQRQPDHAGAKAGLERVRKLSR